MSATSHGRRSWKDSPTAKAIAAMISLLLIDGLIAVLAFALLYLCSEAPLARASRRLVELGLKAKPRP
jgi:hypothetical protein